MARLSEQSTEKPPNLLGRGGSVELDKSIDQAKEIEQKDWVEPEVI